MKGITLKKHKSMTYFIYDLDTLIDTIDGYKPKRDTIERYGFQYDLDTLETVVQCTDTHVNMFWHGHRLTQIASQTCPTVPAFFLLLAWHAQSHNIQQTHAPESYQKSYRSGGVAPESYRKSYRSGGVVP